MPNLSTPNKVYLIDFGEPDSCLPIIRGFCLESEEDAVLYLKNPAGISRSDRRAQLDALAALNQNVFNHMPTPRCFPEYNSMKMTGMQASVPS